MAMRRAIERTPITPIEARALALLSPTRVSYPVGSPQKRFARDLQGATALSDKQRAFLWRTAWSYRRQYRDAAVLAEAERLRPWALEMKRRPDDTKPPEYYPPCRQSDAGAASRAVLDETTNRRLPL